MELIYIWIEKFRNIKKCGISLNKSFIINISEEGYLDSAKVSIYSTLDQLSKIEETKKRIKENFIFSEVPRSEDLNAIIPRIRIDIEIQESKCIDKLYGDNVKSITAIVGKNSVGKSNILDCIGDVYGSLNSSSFVLIYFDYKNSNFIIECNQISVNVLGNEIYAVKGSYQPKTKTVRVNKDGEMIEFEKSELEYISISEKLNHMIYPNANAFSSDIPRFGLQFDRSNIYYAYNYLTNPKNDENFKNNGITVLIEYIKRKVLRFYHILFLMKNTYLI